MRAVASYLAGIGILASLMFVGGAWTSPTTANLEAVPVHPAHASFGLSDEFSAVVGTTTTTAATLPPGCDIPRREARCAPTVVAGGLDFPEPEPEPEEAVVAKRAVQAQPATPTARKLVPRDVEVWRPLVEAYFAPGDVARALAVISCESSGDPNAKNPRSSASGLFQHLGRFWDERSADAGVLGADIFDPAANVAVAAWLVYEGGGWSHWNPSRHCWG